MVDIKPFYAYLPKPENAKEVAAPPYDVLTIQEGKDLVANNPNSFLHVEKAGIDFPIEIDEHSEVVHQKARTNLKRLIEEKVLNKTLNSHFYLYRQIMGKYQQTGIVAASSIEEYNQGIIRKHELTREDKEIDRTDHIDTVNANTGAVFLTYKHQKEIDDFVAQKIKEKPYIDFTAEDSVQHTLWIVSLEDSQKVRDAFTKVPRLYIADGHHRAAAASRVAEKRKHNNPQHNGQEGYNYFLTVIIPDNQVNVMDYNRALRTMNGFTRETLLETLKEKFDISPVIVSNPEEAKPKYRTCFTMFIEGVWYYLRTKQNYVPKDSPVNALDVSILQKEVLQPYFGIQNPRNDPNLDFIGGIRGMRELVKRCQEDCKIGFALHPTGVDQMMEIADANEVMPPKSTWFEPKLRSGVIVRLLED